MDRNSFYDNLRYYKKYSITHSGTPGTAGYKPEKPRDDHKYVEIRNGRYIYQEDLDREKEAQKTREQAQQEAYRREQERKNAEANRRKNAEAAANAEKDRYTQKQSQEYLQATGQVKTKSQQNNTEIQRDPNKASKEYLQETGQIKVEKPQVSTMSASEKQQQEAYKRQQEREAKEESQRKNAEAAANAEKNKNANTNQNKQTKTMTTKSWEDEQREAHKRQQEREAEAKAREENARKNAEAAANAGKDRGKSEGKDKHDSDWNAKIEEEQTKWDKAIDATYKENDQKNKERENNIASKKSNSKALFNNYKGDSEFGSKFSEAAEDLGISISFTSDGNVIYYDHDLQNKINGYADEANAKFKEYQQAKDEAQNIQDPEERLKKLSYANDRYHEYMNLDNLRQSMIYRMEEDAYDKFDEVIKQMDKNKNASTGAKIAKKIKNVFK